MIKKKNQFNWFIIKNFFQFFCDFWLKNITFNEFQFTFSGWKILDKMISMGVLLHHDSIGNELYIIFINIYKKKIQNTIIFSITTYIH